MINGCKKSIYITLTLNNHHHHWWLEIVKDMIIDYVLIYELWRLTYDTP